MVRVAYIEIYNEAVRDLLNPYKPISNKAFCIENDGCFTKNDELCIDDRSSRPQIRLGVITKH